MDYSTQNNNDKMAAIARYLSYGWALVPLHHIRSDGCCSCGNPACRSAGKHPMFMDWTNRVYRDPHYWDGPVSAPYNVGIVTGTPSGFWVLDWDPNCPGAGSDALSLIAELESDEHMMPHVRTGGGGDHWRFTLPADFDVTNRRGTLPAGLDVRGTGGQVVAPPSVSGKGPYVELSDAAPYAPPGWLLDMIRPAVRAPTTGAEPPAGWSPVSTDSRGSRYARATVGALLDDLRHARHNRNDAAWRAACRIIEMTNAGWLPEDDWPGKHWRAATLAHPDGIVVPESEIQSIWRSAQRHVGGRAAEIHTDDPLAVSPLGPPLPPWEPPPFAPSGNGAVRPVLATLTDDVAPVATADGVDPRWEAAIQYEMSRTLVRDEARRRLAAGAVGDLDARVAALDGEWLDVAGVLALPALEPLIEGVLYRDSLARINGPSGHGKSFIAIDLAARVSRGLPWAGRAVTAGSVDYFVAEGARGIGARLRAWQGAHGPLDGRAIRFLPRAVQVLGNEWPVYVESARRRRPALIVIDTQARATEGIDEVDRAEMSRLVAAAEVLRQATGACVLLVHHTPQKGDDGRGHTEVKGALQSEMLARKAGRTITVTSRKQKDHDDFEPIEFDLIDVEPIEDGGRPVLANAVPLGVVPTWRGERPAGVEGMREPIGKTRARQLWQVIHDRYNPGMGGTQSEIRQAWADVTWADRPTTGAAANAFRKAWARAWADLIQRGLLAKAYGASRFKVVVLTDQASDGVLTSNLVDEKLTNEGPTGFEVILTDKVEYHS